MCDFCCDFENVEDLISHRIKIGDLNDNFIETSLTIHADEKNSELIFSQMLCGNDLADAKLKINFCPMCGRKLNNDFSIDFQFHEAIRNSNVADVLNGANIICQYTSTCNDCELEGVCPLFIDFEDSLKRIHKGKENNNARFRNNQRKSSY